MTQARGPRVSSVTGAPTDSETDVPAKRVARPQGRPADRKAAVGADALIASACDLLARFPPAAVSWARLARHADVDPKLLRYYFQDRAGALLAAARHLTAQLQSQAASADNAKIAPPTLLAARIRRLLSFKVRNPFYHRLITDEIALSDDTASRAFFQQLSVSAVDQYRTLLNAGVTDTSLRPVNPVFLYLMIIGASEFSASAKAILAANGETEADDAKITAEYADFVCDVMLNGLVPR